MNEKLLNDLLASAVRNGHVSSELNDEIVDRILEQPGSNVSDASTERVKSKLKMRMQDAAITAARATIHPQVSVQFGRFIQTVREGAGLDRSAIGERLQKTGDFVERLERGHVNPLQLKTNEFADVVELFHIKFSALQAMVTASAS